MLISLISSFSNFLTSSHLVKFFRLTAPATVLCHLGAISLKNLTRHKEVRKGADQANSKKTLFSESLPSATWRWIYPLMEHQKLDYKIVGGSSPVSPTKLLGSSRYSIVVVHSLQLHILSRKNESISPSCAILTSFQ